LLPRRTRTRRLELGAALAAALVLGGCGSGGRRAAPPPPRFPADVAAQLASQSDRVAERLAASDGCGALDAARQLQSQAVAAINAGRVPARFKETLASAASDLPLRIHCSPRAAPATTAEQDHHKRGEHRHEKHGHGHDHRKHDR
jgi:hypothetical protein